MSTTRPLPEGDPRELDFVPERLARITRTMDAAVEAGTLPGAITIVARKGKVVHKHITGRLDMEREAPLREDSLFRMYSQTKPITAAVLLSLFEDGAFMLNDPISKWLPEFANPKVVAYPVAQDRVRGMGAAMGGAIAAKRELTLFDLLTMTSGLPAMGRTRAWSQDC